MRKACVSLAVSVPCLFSCKKTIMVPLAMTLETRFSNWVSSSTCRPRIILGTASPSRRSIMNELAEQHGFTYSVITADIDEKSIRRPDPLDLVLTLARAKRDAIVKKLKAADAYPGPNTFLITCDQVVVHNGNVLEKPRDEQEARAFIAGYALSPASTVGSVICTDLSSIDRSVEAVDKCLITFKPGGIPSTSVDQLIEEGGVYKCAGGLMIEHPLVTPHIQEVVGTQDGVMGLCKALVLKLLLEASGLYTS